MKLFKRQQFRPLSRIVEEERHWFAPYAGVVVYVVLAALVIAVLAAIFVSNPDNAGQLPRPDGGKENAQDRAAICKGLGSGNYSDAYHSTLCSAIVSGDNRKCGGLSPTDAKKCIDSSYLYSFYRSGDGKYCQKMQDINLRELCLQISEKSCNSYFGYPGYCDSIVKDNVAACADSMQETSSAVESCHVNFRIYSAIHNSPVECDSIVNEKLRSFCRAVSRA